MEELLISNNIAIRNERVLSVSRQPPLSILGTSKQSTSKMGKALAEARFGVTMPRPVEVLAARVPGAAAAKRC